MKWYHKPLVMIFLVLIPQLLLIFSILKYFNYLAVNILIFLIYIFVFIRNYTKKFNTSFRNYILITILSIAQCIISIWYGVNLISGELFYFGISLNLFVQIVILLTMFYGITGLFVLKTNSQKVYSIGPEFLKIISIIIVSYIIYSQIYRIAEIDNINNFLSYITIIIYYVILILGIRLCYILFIQKERNLFFIKLTIILFIPIIGLLLNNSVGGVIADFSGIYYYVIPFINLVFLIPTENLNIRMFLFFIKSVTYSYTIYFFIVFIPLYPFAPFLLIYAGIGLLIMGPFFLMVLHTFHLVNEYISLKSKKLTLLFISGLFVIPLVMMISFKFDKLNLELAIDSMYNSHVNVNINQSKLVRSIVNIRSFERSRNIFDETSFRGTPFITPFYNSIVLKDIVMTNEIASNLEDLYLNKIEVLENHSVENLSTGEFTIENINSETVYDDNLKEFKSIIDMEIKSGGSREYITKFNLPDGSYIKNYYLYVNSQKKYGQITDKRIANSVYNSIVETRLDPGIMSYVGDNNIELKVFPFTSGQVRKTGFEIVHKEPVKLSIDNQVIVLSNGVNSEIGIIENDNGIYLPANEKGKLEKINRIPKYNFIIDTSKGSSINDNISALKAFINKNNIKEGKVCFANYEINTMGLSENWEKYGENINPKGKLNFDLSVKSLIMDDVNGNNVIIVFSNDISNVVRLNGIFDYSNVSPDTVGNYFVINSNNMIETYSLIDNKLQKDMNLETFQVLKYNDLYLRDDNNPEIILKEESSTDNFKLSNSNWDNGFNLDIMYKLFHKNKDDFSNNPLNIIKGSIESKIMTPLTSYIVVETKLQEDEINARQNKLLESNDYNSIEPIQMSEPSIFIFIIVFVIWYLINARKRRT